MDNHLGNNERFSILPGHKGSRHSPHPHLMSSSSGRAHLVVAGNKKTTKGFILGDSNWNFFPSRLPCGHPYTHQFSRIKGHYRLIMNTSTAPVPNYFPLVNSSFGNNENSAIARKCAGPSALAITEFHYGDIGSPCRHPRCIYCKPLGCLSIHYYR